MRILILDDSIYVLKIIVKQLKLYLPEAQIETAANGKDGLDLYYAFRPDFLITDLLMPGLCGQDVIKEIRKNDSATSIIVMSADVQLSTKLEVSEYDILQFINKPINEEKIKRIVDIIKGDSIA